MKKPKDKKNFNKKLPESCVLSFQFNTQNSYNSGNKYTKSSKGKKENILKLNFLKKDTSPLVESRLSLKNPSPIKLSHTNPSPMRKTKIEKSLIEPVDNVDNQIIDQSLNNGKVKTIEVEASQNFSEFPRQSDISDFSIGDDQSNNYLQKVRKFPNSRKSHHINTILQKCPPPPKEEKSENEFKIEYSGRKMSQFPILRNSHKVTHLNLSKNLLNNTGFLIFRSTLLRFDNLRVLNLSRNGFTILGKSFFKFFENLEEFDISYNLLSEVSYGFMMLKKLRVLCIQGNKIEVLPSVLKFMTSLKTLEFDWGEHIKVLEDSEAELQAINVVRSPNMFSRENSNSNSTTKKKSSNLSRKSSGVRGNFGQGVVNMVSVEGEMGNRGHLHGVEINGFDFNSNGNNHVLNLDVLRKSFEEAELLRRKHVNFFDYYRNYKGFDLILNDSEIRKLVKTVFKKEHEGFLIHLLKMVPEKMYSSSLRENILEQSIELNFQTLPFYLLKHHYTNFEIMLEKDKGTYGHIALNHRFLKLNFFTELMRHLKGVDTPNWRGFSMLHILFNIFKPQEFRKISNIVELLLLNRANPNKEDGNGMTPFVHAIKTKNMPAVGFSLTWNMKVNQGELKYLGYSQFDLRYVNKITGKSPLHYSCEIPSLNMIKDIIGGGREVNPLQLDYNLKTPYDLVDRSYLSSKKLMMRYERRGIKMIYEVNKESLRTVNKPKKITIKKEKFSKIEYNINRQKSLANSQMSNPRSPLAYPESRNRLNEVTPRKKMKNEILKKSEIDLAEEGVSAYQVPSSRRGSSKVTTKSHHILPIRPSMISLKGSRKRKHSLEALGRFSVRNSVNSENSEITIHSKQFNIDDNYLKFQKLIVNSCTQISMIVRKIELACENKVPIKKKISIVQETSYYREFSNKYDLKRPSSLNDYRTKERKNFGGMEKYINFDELSSLRIKQTISNLVSKIQALLYILKIYKNLAGLNFNFVKGSKIFTSLSSLINQFEILSRLFKTKKNSGSMKNFSELIFHSFLNLFSQLSQIPALGKEIEYYARHEEKICFSDLCSNLNTKTIRKMGIRKNTRYTLKDKILGLLYFKWESNKNRVNLSRLKNFKNAFNSLSSMKKLKISLTEKKFQSEKNPRKNLRFGLGRINKFENSVQDLSKKSSHRSHSAYNSSEYQFGTNQGVNFPRTRTRKILTDFKSRFSTNARTLGVRAMRIDESFDNLNKSYGGIGNSEEGRWSIGHVKLALID